jgi:hypothetical protein
MYLYICMFRLFSTNIYEEEFTRCCRHVIHARDCNNPFSLVQLKGVPGTHILGYLSLYTVYHQRMIKAYHWALTRSGVYPLPLVSFSKQLNEPDIQDNLALF